MSEHVQKFSVVFRNDTGIILKTRQLVARSSDAVPPVNPIKTGYTFKEWSPDYRNIQKNTTCYASYEKTTANGSSIPNVIDGVGVHQIKISQNVSAWTMIGDNENSNSLKDSLVAVQIGDQCTEIGPSCFMNCRNLLSVFLPETCRKFGDYAFYGCSSLEYVTCLRPNAYRVNFMGNHAFDGCASLKEIYLDLSSQYYGVGLGTHCFANCTGLKKFEQYNSSWLGAYMFSGCTNLEEIKLPVNTNYVFQYALADIPNIKKITIPNTIWFINNYMFQNDTNLTSIEIVDTDEQRSVMNMVLEGAFDGCDNLKEITLPRSINSISCLDAGFLLGSSVEKINFTGLPDSVFANSDSTGINNRITTFGKNGSCTYVSSSGRSFVCNNTSYIEYVPEARVDNYETEDFRYGIWYYNAQEVREFADKHNIPVLIEYSSVGCNPCIYFKRNVFNNSDFQAWVGKCPYLFCRVETEDDQNFDNSTAYPQAYYLNNVWARESPNFKNQGIPVFMWYWKKAGDQQASVWDISSYHFAAQAAGSKPPFSMEELMEMTDNKFSGYVRNTKFNRYDISNLYSTEQKIVGRFYENVPELTDDMNGRYFQCTFKKDMGTTVVSKTINIQGYNPPWPTSIQKNTTVKFKPGTYQYYTAPADDQYFDSSFIIFRIDSSAGQNKISYLLSGYNSYGDDYTRTPRFDTGVWHKYTADSSAQTFTDIARDSELVDTPILVACLDGTSKSTELVKLLESDDFMYFVHANTVTNGMYFVQVRPTSWTAGLGKAVVEFVNDENKKTLASEQPGFSAWDTTNVPTLYIYLGCQSCSEYGSPPSVEIAARIDVSGIATVEQLVSKIREYVNASSDSI